MSYCRWSSDDFQCDIYCYESVHGGYVIDIASNRPVLPDDAPPQVAFDQDNLTAYIARHATVMRMLDTAERRPIGLPLDGESFTDATPHEAAERLQGLKDMGYNVPQYAIDELREEAADAPLTRTQRQANNADRGDGIPIEGDTNRDE